MDNIPWMFRIANMRVYFEMTKRKAEIFCFFAFKVCRKNEYKEALFNHIICNCTSELKTISKRALFF